LICKGFKNAEIALMLKISSRTVEGFRSSLLEKTGANSTAELVKYAMENDHVAFDLRKRQSM